MERAAFFSSLAPGLADDTLEDGDAPGGTERVLSACDAELLELWLIEAEPPE